MKERTRALVDILVLVALLVGVPLILTSVSIHNYSQDCSARGGMVQTDTWHGVPTASTCIARY